MGLIRFLKRRRKKKLLENIEKSIRKGRLSCAHLPIEWFFEISKRCNIKCRTCARIYDERFDEKTFSGNMKPEIQGAVDSYLTDSLVVHSVGFGEPFMNPHALDFIKTIKDHGPKLDIITNGTLLKGKVDDLILSGLDDIIVSMDGGTKEVFEYFRAGAKWDQVEQSLSELAERKKALNRTNPKIWIEFVAMRGNIHTLPLIIEKAALEWGAHGVSVEPLYQVVKKGYLDFYMDQNLFDMPWEEMDGVFRLAEEAAKKHNIIAAGPYFEGDRKKIWQNARIKAIGYIDHPGQGQVTHGLKPITGWALHPSGVEKVCYSIGDYIDGEVRCEVSRPDVAANEEAFPGEDNCGFMLPIDFSDIKEGKNSLVVRVIDKKGNETKLQPVKFRYIKDDDKALSIPSFTPTQIQLDTPTTTTPVDDPHLVVGWSVPPLPEKLTVFVDDQEMGEAFLGFDRPDVKELANIGGVNHPDLNKCGFYMPLHLSPFKDGAHELRIERHAKGETPTDIVKMQFTLKRGSRRDQKEAKNPEGKIEAPFPGDEISGIRPFTGWAVYGPAVAEVRLECDGESIGLFCHDFNRPDIHSRFAANGISARIGFAAMVDCFTPTEGEHTFRLTAVESSGDITVLDEVSCNVVHDEDDKLRRSPSGLACPQCECDGNETKSPCKEQSADEKVLIGADPSRKTVFSPFCTFPWTTCYVAFDGNVRTCCYAEPGISLGDLNTRSFPEIWNGEEYQALRREILNGSVPKACRECITNARIHGRAIFDKFSEFLD